jgi:hypothetical protein
MANSQNVESRSQNPVGKEHRANGQFPKIRNPKSEIRNFESA